MKKKVIRRALYLVLFLGVFFTAMLMTVSSLVKSRREVVVPPVIGLDQEEARESLSTHRLELVVRGYRFDPEAAPNTVVSQSHKSGFVLPEGRSVSVVLSKGSKTRVVPDVVHLPLKTALEVLRSSEIKGRVQGRVCSRGIAEERVMAQSPLSHERTSKDTVNLLVSSGECEDRFLLRDLKGDSLKNVLAELSEAGLTLRTIQYSPSDVFPPGIILSHYPPAYSMIPQFQMVHFDVVRRKRPREPEEGRFVYFPIRVPYGFLPKRARIELVREKSNLTYAHVFMVGPGEKRPFLFWKDSDTEVALEFNGLLAWRRSF